MKSVIFALLFIGSFANARILSVSRYLEPGINGQLYFVVEFETCSNAFASVIPHTTKLQDGIAQMELTLFPGDCANLTKTVRFFIDAEDELKQLGLDPKTAKVFIQLQ